MRTSDINPHIRYARYHLSTTLPTICLYCYDCRLFFIKEGKGSLTSENTEYKFSNNSVIFVPPGTKYQFSPPDNNKPLSLLIFNFDLVNDFSHLVNSLGTATDKTFVPGRVIRYDMPPELSSIVTQTAPQLHDMLVDSANEFLHKDRYYHESASALLKCALIEFLRKASLASNYTLISQVTEYIHAHYTESDLTNSAIAQNFNYHPYHLSKLMKEATGETLRSYLLHYRLRMAKNALITTKWDISTIAWKCGFNSTAYFIKQFKERTGVTPKHYRKTHQNPPF